MANAACASVPSAMKHAMHFLCLYQTAYLHVIELALCVAKDKYHSQSRDHVEARREDAQITANLTVSEDVRIDFYGGLTTMSAIAANPS